MITFMKKYLLSGFVFLIILALAVFGTAVFEFNLRVPLDSSKKISFAIEQDSGVHEISRNLRARGLITSSFLFESYVWLVGADHKFRAGNYSVSPGMNMRGLTKLFTTARAREELTITILEGWTLRDIKSYLSRQGWNEMANFDYLAGISAVVTPGARDWSGEFTFLSGRPKSSGLEGFLFPDTYRVFADASSEDVIRKMLQNFEQKFDANLLLLAKQKKMSVFEVIILASIIEREVRGYEDRRKVADIFLRRLRLGMPLQADATVNYVTGKTNPSISYEDRDFSSLWNTYKYPGLPQGPIGNPGLSAIRAVLDPESTPYLYFLTTKEGEVIYSRTLDEHNRAKAKYLN